MSRPAAAIPNTSIEPMPRLSKLRMMLASRGTGLSPNSTSAAMLASPRAATPRKATNAIPLAKERVATHSAPVDACRRRSRRTLRNTRNASPASANANAPTIIPVRCPLSRKYRRQAAFDSLPSGVSVVSTKPTTKSTTKAIAAIPLQRSPLRVFPTGVAAMSLPFVRPKPQPRRPQSSTPTAARPQGLLAERLEHRAERVDAAPARRAVALLLDAGADELEVEATRVPGRQHLAEDALEGEVAVAGDEPVRGRQRPDREVADLDEPEPVGAGGDRVGEAAFRPARVDLHAHAGIEPAGDVDRVGQRVDEADVDPQRVRVLDRERDSAGAGLVQHRRQGGLEGVGRLLPGERAGGAGREHQALRAHRGRRVEGALDPLTLCFPAIGLAEMERTEPDEVRHPQPGVDHAAGAVLPSESLELRHRDPHVRDPRLGVEREVGVELPGEGRDGAERRPRMHGVRQPRVRPRAALPPPSRARLTPVTNSDSRLARYTAAWATSSASPRRGKCIPSRRGRRGPGGLGGRRSVWTRPRGVGCAPALPSAQRGAVQRVSALRR